MNGHRSILGGKSITGLHRLHVSSIEIPGHRDGRGDIVVDDGVITLPPTHPVHGVSVPILMGTTQLSTRHIPEPTVAKTHKERYNQIDFDNAANKDKLVVVATGGVSYAKLSDDLSQESILGYASATHPAEDTYKHGLCPAGSATGTRFLCENGLWGQPSVHTGVVTSSFRTLQDTPADFVGATGKYLKVGPTGNGDGIVFTSLADDLKDISDGITVNELKVESDARLKKDIYSYTDKDAERVLRGIQPVRYKYKNRPQSERIGVLADQVKRVLPDSVVTNGDTGMMSVCMIDLIGVLLAANKAVLARLDAIEAKLQ